jgi:hypothetical protein
LTLPNLAGVATKDLVETIGTGRFQASYINWSRTLNLLRTHAPGWTANCITADDGSLLHKAPIGAYLLIQFVHTDGSETPAVPQAVMDNRNNAIPYEKITARDITDTQRRGTCLAASFTFGLAYELWAKMPLESGYAESAPEPAPESAPKTTGKASRSSGTENAEAAKVSEASFREVALEKGVHTVAIDALVAIVNEKLGGDFDKGCQTLNSKSADELNSKYAPSEAGPGNGADSQW